MVPIRKLIFYGNKTILSQMYARYRTASSLGAYICSGFMFGGTSIAGLKRSMVKR